MSKDRFRFQLNGKWRKPLLLALLGVISLVSGPMALAQQAYSDTEFDFDNQWSLFGPYIIPGGAPNGGFSAEQSLADGNPDAHLAVTLTRPTVDLGEAAAAWPTTYRRRTWPEPSNSSASHPTMSHCARHLMSPERICRQ